MCQVTCAMDNRNFPFLIFHANSLLFDPTVSKWRKKVKYEVTQGFVLGPLLFFDYFLHDISFNHYKNDTLHVLQNLSQVRTFICDSLGWMFKAILIPED